MKAVDTDIFVIAALHPEDRRAEINNEFIALMRLQRGNFVTTIFNKLETVGVCSFGMTQSQLDRLWEGFEEHFGVEVIFPARVDDWQQFSEKVRIYLYRRMKFGDALVLLTAESHPDVDTFVTWNAKHFKVGVTQLDVGAAAKPPEGAVLTPYKGCFRADYLPTLHKMTSTA